MSKVNAPLLSFNASGAIAKTQVYASWKGRPYVRRYVIPANPDTTEQQSTRNVFAWLQNVWKFAPAQITEAFDAYASGQVMTGPNALIKTNLSALRGDTDLSAFLFSPGAKSGPPAAAIGLTPGSGSMAVAITAPTLPTGWTIDRGIAAGIRDQDPHSGILYTITAGEDATSTYSVSLTGLTSGELYRFGAWFKYVKPDGTYAYGPSILDSDTPS